MISIKRDSGFADKTRAYKVILDGEEVGKIKDGQKIKIDIAPGGHKLYIKIDWCQSNIVEFEMNENIIEFECGSNLRGPKLLLPFIILIYITFRKKQYIWLKKKN